MRFTVMTVLAAAYMCRTRFAMVRSVGMRKYSAFFQNWKLFDF